MSKDTNNLRLLGSPVNLSYRGKKNNDRKNIRNRPRSALQNSCFTPDNKERYKRPFSADAKASSSTRTFFNNFNSEVPQTYSGYPITTVRVVAPTAALLGNSKAERPSAKNKDICSNASDYGSEDTFISLGTKIKAKAQSRQKPKEQNKSFKFRNFPKKGQKHMEGSNEPLNDYGLEVKITERQQSPRRRASSRSPSPNLRRAYEAYFIQFEPPREQDIAGRVSFGHSKIDEEVEQAIDTYSRRLTLTKQQLSLVEEEPQEAENPSQNATHHDMSSLSPEEPIEDSKNVNVDTGRHTYVVENDKNEDFTSKQNLGQDQRTYRSFYDDFQSSSFEQYKTKRSSSMEPTDASSKDSGYPDSGHNEEKSYQKIYSFPGLPLKKSNSHNRVENQPKSLDSLTAKGDDKDYRKTFPLDKKSQWAEPLNHSRLLYKDFFLKKEGHISMPPQNSPTTSNNNNVVENIPNVVAVENQPEEANDNNLDYPSYLRNSTTKAYTSKVIEDYKKELEAINNLHDLTIKDIKTDAISPTPLNIDRMFEQHCSFTESKDDSANIPEASNTNNKNALDLTKADVSKVSTKELIQNYLKVKESVNHMNNKDYGAKSFKKVEKKTSNVSKSEVNIAPYRHDVWNNRPKAGCTQVPKSVNVKGQAQKTPFTLRPPMSARIGDVQNDKDVESWMSLSSSSPRNEKDREIECPIKSTLLNTSSIEQRASSPPADTSSLQMTSIDKDALKKKELDSTATVFDIYSMLKEIESYGDNPVTAVTGNALPEVENKKETDSEGTDHTPKDNFMEIFEFLEKVEKSANDALSVVTTSAPTTTPKLEVLLKLPPTELAQRLITASLQLEERSCCIALLQESLANHKEQMINKVSNLEKQSIRNITKVKQDCEEAVKRHQAFIDQLINDKKTLNHRIEQLVDERRSLEERWKRSAQALEERYKLELRNQHDKMVASQQVARQRWVRQKAEKIKELTVKGLEGELREMAERQQKEISDLKMYYAEQIGRMQSKHAAELEALRRGLEEEKETALIKERQIAASRMEKQILELEVTYQEQRTRLIADIRAENERVASDLSERERQQREDIEKWKEEQEKLILDKRIQIEQDLTRQREEMEENMKQKEKELQEKFEQFKKDFEAEQQLILKRKVIEISTQHKLERDREIEKAIESMEAEAQAGRKEMQEALRRNKEQYEAELKELAETEKATLRRYQEAQARIRQTEDKCAELEVTISQLETRNKIITEKNIQLEKQGEDLRSRLEHSWQDKVHSLQREIEDIKKVHEEQMHQLYAKVKVAVARKDSAIQALTREAAKYQEKITTLEQKLHQQRKDFLKHK